MYRRLQDRKLRSSESRSQTLAMNSVTASSSDAPYPKLIERNPNAAGVLHVPLSSFAEMWYQMFLWALFSSVFVHTIAAAICFATLRKHKYGKFFPILILVMGLLLPLTSGVLSSATVAFVYRGSNYQMSPLYALFWGIGQTVVAACVGFTRILATL